MSFKPPSMLVTTCLEVFDSLIEVGKIGKVILFIDLCVASAKEQKRILRKSASGATLELPCTLVLARLSRLPGSYFKRYTAVNQNLAGKKSPPNPPIHFTTEYKKTDSGAALSEISLH